MAAFTRSDYTIQRAPQQCSVIVGRNPTRSVAKLLRDGGANNVAIVTDDKVPLYVVDRVFVSLGDYDIKCDVLKFPSGEASKHLKHLPAYVDWLTSRGFGKRDYVWGVGGGVVTDVAGLLAAGLGRGANFVSSPSTLLGMVDAGMGGNNGRFAQQSLDPEVPDAGRSGISQRPAGQVFTTWNRGEADRVEVTFGAPRHACRVWRCRYCT